ncbi:MAG: AAA family ATPase [Planctomycetaceae bacterium]|nr:AAA family ATPase [Planctomycetaceae bacterium]
MELKLPHDFLVDLFGSNPANPALAIEHALVAKVPDGVVVATPGLDQEQYERLQFCTAVLQAEPRPIVARAWGGEEADHLEDQIEQALWKIEWNNESLYVLQASWNTSCGMEQRKWVIAASGKLADEFILDVARKTNYPGEAILVFRDGRWSRSAQLYQAVQRSSFDDLILDDAVKTAIRSDFRQFLEARDQYTALGLAWRRGALLIGPPGNGKTHCVRALVKELAVACLYVQSLHHQYYESEQLLQRVFERARELRPCVLIFEDLDALVDAQNQSFFLNQLDGLEKNDGLVVLATTNHPERIDAAIIDRPSRFDRKYHFELPNHNNRRLFLAAWQMKLADQVNWTAAVVETLAELTDGFSFAYLKELVVSSLLAWMADSSESFDRRLLDQQQLLSGQMRTVQSPASVPHKG